MQFPENSMRLRSHDNAFGALRLLFASMVVCAHGPELVDGNRNREILTSIFGTLSFGELAVIWFFVVSGYLISGSYIKSSSTISYLSKRSARIYPGFIVAFLICVLVVAPLGGGEINFSFEEFSKLLLDCLLLQPPMVDGVFLGSAYPLLNGSLWTIAYEFRCYLLIVLVGFLGVLNRRRWMLAITIIFMILTIVLPDSVPAPWMKNSVAKSANLYSMHDIRVSLIGSIRQEIRLIAAFLTGVIFYIYRYNIRFNRTGMVLCIVSFFILISFKNTAVFGSTLFGGYVIFLFAAKNKSKFIGAINNKNDISYGLYLYAWPVAKLISWYWPNMNLISIVTLTWIIALILGWASWIFVEKPAIKWMRFKLSSSPARNLVE